MEKKIVVDCNWSWGQLVFENSKDAMALFELLGKAQHVDNRYLHAEDGGRCYHYISTRIIEPSIRSLTIYDEHEMERAVEISMAIEEQKKAAKAAEEAEAV
jgi:hypothetical protein